MAESFAILGIVVNILQLVDFGSKVLVGSYRLYKSSSELSDEHRHLNLLAENSQTWCKKAKEIVRSSQVFANTTEGQKLHSLAVECEGIARGILNTVKSLKIPKNASLRTFRVIKSSVKEALGNSKLQELVERMTDIEDRLRFEIYMMLQQSSQSELLSTLQDIRSELQVANNREILAVNAHQNDLLDMIGQSSTSTNQLVVGVAELLRVLIELDKKRDQIKHQNAILGSLKYENMNDRQEMVHDAETITLDWIFEDRKILYMDWLEKDEKVYWVRGKPGSDKSTLMKFLYANKKVLAPLRVWALPGALYTAFHFFWNSGSPTQKSQKGLLQALLYQLFRANPDLISEVLEDRDPQQVWTRFELLRALERVSESTSAPERLAKLCFFIDGLDEYEEQDGYQSGHAELIDVLKKLSNLPNVKLCVSSRPWPIFEAAFGQSVYQLSMEDLNRADLAAYVWNKLGLNRLFIEKSDEDPRCHALIEKIVERAQGVWLWVYLVVRDLLRDIAHFEDYPQLLRRLESFPIDLEEYFENILKRVEGTFRTEAARIFILAIEAKRPLSLFGIRLFIRETQDPDFDMLDSGSVALKAEKGETHKLVVKYKCLVFNRCRDLLEINRMPRSDPGSRIVGLHGYRVEFLHRTVRDFLKGNNLGNLKENAGSDSSPATFLCRINVAILRSLSRSESVKRSTAYTKLFPPLANDALSCAQLSEARGTPCKASSLNVLQEVLSSNTDLLKDVENWTKHRHVKELSDCSEQSFLVLAVHLGLVAYVQAKLAQQPLLMHKMPGRSLLECVLTLVSLGPSGRRVQNSEDGIQWVHNPNKVMVEILLRFGADPNWPAFVIGAPSIWQLFLSFCLGSMGETTQSDIEMRADIIAMLFEAGGDPHIRVDRISLDTAIRSMFATHPFQAKSLLSILESKIAMRRKQESSDDEGVFRSSGIVSMLGWCCV